MEIDASTYPSRAFIRFTAQNQLMADLTGRPITAMVQRLGGESYVQQVMPEDQPKTLHPDDSNLGFSLGMSVNPVESNGSYGDSQVHAQTPLDPPGSEVPHNGSETEILDEALFEEIAKTSFSPNRYPELYQSCGTRRAAAAIEAQVAKEIVATYKQIKQKQQCPIVQGLNGLL